jgi:hypothetical protein
MCSSSTPFKVWARQEGNCGASGAKSVGVITQWLAMMSVKVLLAVSREGAAALCAEFAVRVEDLGVFTSCSAFRCGTGILPVFHGRDTHATRGFVNLFLSSALLLLITHTLSFRRLGKYEA